MNIWTPSAGASQLRWEYPVGLAELLCTILTGEITPEQMAADVEMHRVLHRLGGKHAIRLLDDPTGERLSHWPRVWAARTLALVGDFRCAPALEQATKDMEWRVRMQAIRAASLVCKPRELDKMGALLISDKSARVRSTLALCLGRNGGSDSIMLLGTLLRDSDTSVRNHADRALTRLQSRL